MRQNNRAMKKAKQTQNTFPLTSITPEPVAAFRALCMKHKKPLRNILKIAKTSLNADEACILLPDKGGRILMSFLSTRSAKKSKNPASPSLDIALQVFGSGKSARQESTMAAPLVLSGKTGGILALTLPGERSCTKSDLTTLKNLSENINALVTIADEVQKSRRLKALDEILDALSRNLPATDTIDQQADKVSVFMQKHFPDLLFALFIVIDEKLLQFKAGIGWGIKKGTGLKFSKDGVIGYAAATKKELLIDDILADKRNVEGNKDVRSIFAVPLFRGNEIFGVIAFGSKNRIPWEPELIATLQRISAMVAMKVCNAVSFNEIEYYSKKITNLNKFVNSVIKGFPSGIITIDKWGNITLINEKAQEVFGFTEHDAKRITIRELFKRKSATVNPLLTTLTENKPLTRIETTIVDNNGRKIPIGFSTSLLRDERGNVIGAIGIMKELTKIKEEEEGLRREDRLVALGEMAAGMAHEIRNPLAGIRTGVEYLGRFLDEDKKGAVTMIVKEIKRLNRIVTDMTSYANRPPIKLDKTSISEIVDISLGFMKNELEERKIEIIKGYDPQVPPVLLDSDQIREVFDNILINAVQATEESGKIIITTGTDESGTKAVVRITDNGCGISEQDRERIFNPFFTTKKGGTGLGLSICYRIISEHNGYMVISSKKDKGTTVKIVLPIKPEAQRSP
jgi:two-component system nitrogen regulation sensor histidine kinase GlnL